MNQIMRHIEYLLTDNDCVVVPGLGAFLASYQGAEYDEDTCIISAPGRRFTFNSALTVSDGILINSVARAQSIDYQAAAKRVETGVTAMLDSLRREGEVTIGRIGRLEGDVDSLSFVPFEKDTVSPLVGWIGDIATEQAGTLAHHKRTAEIAAEHKSISSIRIRRFVRNTIGAAAAVLIGLTLSTPVSVDTHRASLTPPVKVTEVVVPVAQPIIETIAESIEEPEVELVAEEVAAVDSKAEESAPVVTPEQAPVQKHLTQEDKVPASTTSLRMKDTDGYVVVVGSLTSMGDAYEFISTQSRKNPGLDFGVIESGGRYRVYAATAPTADEARRVAKSGVIAKAYAGAWVTARG